MINHTITLLLVSIFVLQSSGKQASNTRGAVSRQNLSDKNVRLDPLLRRALLRALTELEKEAQEKVRAEEIRNTRSEPLNGNYRQTRDEIQNTADTNYPSPTPFSFQSTPLNREPSTSKEDESVESSTPVQDNFVYQTPEPEDVNVSIQETKIVNPTANPSEVASNLIADVNDKEKSSEETTEKVENASGEKKEEGSSEKKEKPESNDNEVDIFKAPLVAAFTLHQDSKGTPHSVIPLFRKEPQRQQILDQQFQLYQQQQQQQQQFLQNQFIPSVTITPLSQPNQFNQSPRFFGGPAFASSTVFPPLVSNSIIPQSFPPSVIPSQGFQSTTIAPFRGSPASFLSTITPQRNLSPQSFPSTLLPPQDFSVVPSQNFNFSPTPQPTFPPPTIAPPQEFQPISIPPVTLPLQNEPRFQSPIIVPSVQVNPSQTFIQNQDQQAIRNQFLIEEQNRQRLLEEQNRQRQIEEQNRQKQLEEQNRQRQLEEQRQRQLEEQNRQRQLEEQRQRQQLEELNRQRQLEEERARLIQQNLQQESQLRQQRQEQGVDFQRSLGFSFNRNVHTPQLRNNAFSFQIQPSQSFVPPVNFGDLETRNRVNRQEGFGSTGNLGINQGPRNFAQNQFLQTNQVFPPFQSPQEYRTIPDEHYRNLQFNQFQQNRFQNFRQDPNFRQNNVQEVNKQLQKLLFQSGVATDASGQEDLNIVSKVLALNHERSDTNVQDTIIRDEKRVGDLSEKTLAVGETKEVEKDVE